MIETMNESRNESRNGSATAAPADTKPDGWYRYGVACLLLEMAIAVAVSCYSLFMAFHGLGGFPGKH